MLQGRHEEDRIDRGLELAVRVRHLELRFEVGDGSQAADDEVGATLAAEVDRKAVEGFDVDPSGDFRRARFADRFTDHGQADFGRQHGGLVGVDENAQDHPIENRRRAFDHVEVAERDRVEGARVDGDLHLVPPAPGATWSRGISGSCATSAGSAGACL